MGARSGDKPELSGASVEVLWNENGRLSTAIEQIPFKKNLRNPKKTRVPSFSNLSRCEPLHNFTGFEFDSFRENALVSSLRAGQLQNINCYSRQPTEII